MKDSYIDYKMSNQHLKFSREFGLGIDTLQKSIENIRRKKDFHNRLSENGKTIIIPWSWVIIAILFLFIILK